MDEEEKKTEEKPTADDTGEGDELQTLSKIDEANKAAERLEKANEVKAELLAREERLAVDKKLGGESDAGQTLEKPAKKTDTEYAEALERGEVNPLKEDGII